MRPRRASSRSHEHQGGADLPRQAKEGAVVESVRHPAIVGFLEWAREAIGRDPSFRPQVDAALAELTISPQLRRHIEQELDRIMPVGEAR
jgi:hypothetical protein